MSKEYKPILCLDFDGVIHSYESGWKGAKNIPDPPVEGAMNFLADVVQRQMFEVHIFSSRSHQWGGRKAMKKWLLYHLTEHFLSKYKAKLPQEHSTSFTEFLGAQESAEVYVKAIKFPKVKPPAHMTIDDRGMRFEGIFPDPEALLKFKPWNKRGKK